MHECLCTCECRCPYSPEQGIITPIITPGAGCELPTWMLGIELRSSLRAADGLNYRTISPAPKSIQCLSHCFLVSSLSFSSIQQVNLCLVVFPPVPEYSLEMVQWQFSKISILCIDLSLLYD